ncbi:unnamed protein product [Mytilus edulis]|uniref:Reverse transcriptase RNase H-like domain-containing protein n=1 Tax=Mytilus edulis TaxID=6550 RepID=A0A8S3TM07_MYTED|nr:unnamed protein product [Mytilus edulis]
MLAVVYFTKYFKHYLLGRGFKLRTDHGSLTWLQNFKDPDGQIHRWIQQLSQFHMKIEHRPGNRHGNADAMSRLKTETGIFCKQCEMPWDYIYDGPCHIEIKEMKEGEKTNCPVDTITNSGEFENSDEEVNDHCRSSPQQNSTSFSGFLIGQDDSVSGETSKIKRRRKPNRPKQAKQIPQPDTDLTLEVIRDKQESDSILKQILKYKIEGRKPDWGEISYESVHLKYWLARWESIEMKNGILCMYWDDDTKKGRWKICAPNSIEKTIHWYLHDTKTAGHLGIKKTKCPKTQTYTSEYVTELEERLREAHDLARKHLKKSAERQKILYNTNVKRHNYEKGDLVWRNQKKNTPGLKLKIARQWTGPWVIIDKKSDIIFKIQHSKKSTAVIIHGDNLKPYKGNKKAKWFTENNEERIPVEIPNPTAASNVTKKCLSMGT